MFLYKIFAISCFVLIFFSIANAQISYEGCRDFRGQPVASIIDYSINDIAIARIENGQAVIRYNPNVLAQMSESTRKFFYLHECAHHALQHTIQNQSLQNEREADCWAISKMRDNMGLSLNQLKAIQNDISRFGRGDWNHLPGPSRAIDIENCLEIPNEHKRIPCIHKLLCKHHIPCTHQMHPFDTQHPFDQNYYGNRFQCIHKMPCGHPVHQFDTVHQYDATHEYDYRE